MYARGLIGRGVARCCCLIKPRQGIATKACRAAPIRVWRSCHPARLLGVWITWRYIACTLSITIATIIPMQRWSGMLGMLGMLGMHA